MRKEINKRYRKRQNERGIIRVEICLPVEVVEKLDKLSAAKGLSPAQWVKFMVEKQVMSRH